MSATPYEIAANGRMFEVVDDTTTTIDALVVARAIDETTGRPVATPMSARLVRPAGTAAARTAALGRIGVIGNPSVAIPDPTSAYTFAVAVEAFGFEPVEFSMTVPAGAPVPVAAPDVILRRLPVRLQGRVVRAATLAPVSSARVRLIDPVPAPSVRVVSLRTPLAFGHPAGTNVRTATVVAGATTQADEPARAGARSIVLQDRAGIAPGSVLRIGAERSWEFVVVEGPGGGVLTTPGTVWLRTPLRRTVAQGTSVRSVAVSTGALVDARLARAASPGDTLLVLDASLGAAALQVGDAGVATTEHHVAGAITDSDGYWSLAAVAGVQRVRIEVRIGAAIAAPTPLPLVIDYGRTVNVVDIRVA